jgi:hypothetical protein
VATCKQCGALIEYRKTLAGQLMPVDPDRVAVVTRKGTVVHGRVSHFCTCPAYRAGLPKEVKIYQRKFTPV